MNFGGLNSMWVVVLFDLPTDTKEARKQYTNFRKHLLDDGFGMMQYSAQCKRRKCTGTYKKSKISIAAKW
jgi:CRISPR-associated endonuclease Cas2